MPTSFFANYGVGYRQHRRAEGKLSLYEAVKNKTAPWTITSSKELSPPGIFAQPLDIPFRRSAEHTCVLAAELRNAFISDFKSGR
jgi:hypothetical protein